jgi:hypothetical protein
LDPRFSIRPYLAQRCIHQQQPRPKAVNLNAWHTLHLTKTWHIVHPDLEPYKVQYLSADDLTLASSISLSDRVIVGCKGRHHVQNLKIYADVYF